MGLRGVSTGERYMLDLTPALAAVVAAAAYVASLLVWPNIECRACGGKPHTRAPGMLRRLSRPCRRCGGSGRYPRLGRRKYDNWRSRRTR